MKSFHRGLALLLTVVIAASATDPSRRRLAGSTACGPETGVILGSDPAKPIDLGGLTNYLFFFEDGRDDTNWQGATKGFYGDVAVDGITASERTSGGVPYAGTIYTNDGTIGAFQGIVDQNVGQAFSSVSETTLIDDLTADFNNAWATLDAMPADLAVADASDLHNADYQNGVAETIIVDINGGYSQNGPIELYGDANDMFVFRWGKNEADPYDAQVKFSGGGGIIPMGDLKPGNFVHLAGDLNASGGGSNPPAPFPQGPRPDDGQGGLITGADDWGGGGFFVGYWLTIGNPTKGGESSSLSNGIFVGGWYTSATKFSMTSGTSGVHICPNAAAVAADDSEAPSKVPTGSPVVADSEAPSKVPTGSPVVADSEAPSKVPTGSPVVADSEAPSKVPTGSPVVAEVPTGSPALPVDPQGVDSTDSPTASPVTTTTGSPVAPLVETPENTICQLSTVTVTETMKVTTVAIELNYTGCVTITVEYKIDDNPWTMMCTAHDVYGQAPEDTLANSNHCTPLFLSAGQTVDFRTKTQPSNDCGPGAGGNIVPFNSFYLSMAYSTTENVCPI